MEVDLPVIFEVEEPFVNAGIERGQVMEVDIAAFFPKDLGEKEAGERQFHQHVLVDSFACDRRRRRGGRWRRMGYEVGVGIMRRAKGSWEEGGGAVRKYTNELTTKHRLNTG